MAIVNIETGVACVCEEMTERGYLCVLRRAGQGQCASMSRRAGNGAKLTIVTVLTSAWYVVYQLPVLDSTDNVI